MSETPLFLITRLLGISGSIFLSGFAFSASFYSTPAISLAPLPLRLQQWQVIYDLGKLVSPPLSVATGIAWGSAAWIAKGSASGGEEWKLYAVTAAATFGVLAWTLGAMMGTNLELLRMAKAAREDSGSKMLVGAEKAVATWNWMNYVRAVIPMVGAWVGIYAALK